MQPDTTEQPTTTDILSLTTLPTNTSTNEKVREKWKFLHSIDARCQADEASITRVMSDEQLNRLLLQPFQKPILWRNFAEQHPLHGIPSSISDFLRELGQLGIEKLEAHNYAEEDTNDELDLNETVEHFEAPPETRPPLNFLDIRNLILSRVPVHVNKVDLLRLAQRRKAGSAGKGRPLKALLDYADHEFFLLSSRHSISPLHVDTAGQLTYIVGISGCKTWYLPRNFTADKYEILATYGSSTTETYYDDWVKVDIMPGDLLIMPPGCPHAVFTPEHALTFGGNFYTLPHLGSSLRVLALQAQFNFVFSNESITEQDYRNFLDMLEAYKDEMNPQQMGSVASSGIAWGITDQHKTRKDVSKICARGQGFGKLQAKLRLLIWEIHTKGEAKLHQEDCF
ncbi:hypothetical protein BDV24DRAFT_172555 [Aspergillus arachidicola]|uniref:JmjC domain-containing protein n=1 Tax=Aspergillus arachidicola TaxID=656916 RepID=A0A5N6XQ15_9EURO|nr:hypothetical protein BDV24DRAFT_172555 [Aspergillus arachidicola]